MTSKTIKYLRLISIAISAFFVASCDDPDDIGLNLQEQDDILNAKLVDTLTIETETVLLNDINTSTVTVLLTGAYDDPYVGDISANTYFQVLLSSENPDFGSNPMCDSIKLFLDYNGYYYGDTSETQTLEVYKLTEEIQDDSSYTINSTLNVDPTAIGSTYPGFSVSPTISDSIVEISLNATYGDEIIAAGNTTNDLFVQSIFGLSVRPTSGDFNGAVVGFFAGGDSKVVLYYHNDTDTSTFDLSISSSSMRFNNIVADRSSTSLSSLSSEGDALSTATTSNQGFLQAGTGLATKIFLPNLQQFRDSVGTVAINRAEIVIYPVDGSVTGEHNEPPLFLTMYKTDNTNLILEDANGDAEVIPNDFHTVYGSGIQEFNYDEDENVYKLRLTQYIQDLILENETNGGMLLVPTINSTRVTRFTFYDNANLSNPAKAMKLLLYFTKLDSE